MNIAAQTYFVLLNIIFNHDLVFCLIGLANRRWHFLEGVFVTYPNTEKIALQLAPRWLLGYLKWRPYLHGPYRQTGAGWALKFGISSYPEEIIDPLNRDKRLHLLDRMCRLRELTATRELLFGFALEAVLAKDRHRDGDGNLRVIFRSPAVAAKLAVDTALKIKAENGFNSAPVIFFAAGSMLRRIKQYLAEREPALGHLLIDPQSGWPEEALALINGKVVFISLAKEEELIAVRENLGRHWFIVNEAYLKDPPGFIERLGRPQWQAVYQLCGAKGRTIPDIRNIYRGALPCCQVLSDESMTPMIRRIE